MRRQSHATLAGEYGTCLSVLYIDTAQNFPSSYILHGQSGHWSRKPLQRTKGVFNVRSFSLVLSHAFLDVLKKI